VRQIGTPPASAFKLFVAGFDTPVAIVLEDQIGMHHGMACSDALREQHNRAELELIGVETGQATAIAKAICGVEAE
jgi:hypothetical protein